MGSTSVTHAAAKPAGRSEKGNTRRGGTTRAWQPFPDHNLQSIVGDTAAIDERRWNGRSPEKKRNIRLDREADKRRWNGRSPEEEEEHKTGQHFAGGKQQKNKQTLLTVREKIDRTRDMNMVLEDWRNRTGYKSSMRKLSPRRTRQQRASWETRHRCWTTSSPQTRQQYINSFKLATDPVLWKPHVGIELEILTNTKNKWTRQKWHRRWAREVPRRNKKGTGRKGSKRVARRNGGVAVRE